MPGTLKNNRDLLYSILLDMEVQGDAPLERVDLSELSGQDKMFLLTTTCCEMIMASIIVASNSRDDALKGLESLTEVMKRKIEEGSYEEHRTH